MSPRVQQPALGALLIGLLTVALFAFATANSRNRKADAESLNVELRQQSHDMTQRLMSLEVAGGVAGLPDGLLWDGSNRADAELSLQDAVLGLAKKHLVAPTSFGPAASPPGLETPSVALQFEAETSWAAATAFLAALHDVEPGVGISELWIRQIPPTEEAARVSMRLVVWGFSPGIGDRR